MSFSRDLGMPVFPKNAEGGYIFPETADGKPVPPVTIHGNPVVPIDSYGNPVVSCLSLLLSFHFMTRLSRLTSHLFLLLHSVVAMEAETDRPASPSHPSIDTGLPYPQ